MSRQVDIIGNVGINIAAGRSETYRIPPGDYAFRYDGQTITVRVPLIGEPLEFPATGDLDALYKNKDKSQPLLINRTLRDSIELRGQRTVVLCPSGN